MILPIVLDACTIINLLRIDDEGNEYLFNKLKSLNLFIANSVYSEVFKNVNSKPLAEYQKEAINSQFPNFAKNIFHLDSAYQTAYTDEIQQFCSYHKDNGEFQSTLLSLFLCRKEQCRLVFYTDDFPAKNQFDEYFVFQQIGTIGDSVDLLLFLYWSTPNFSIKCLEKYLINLHGEYSTQLKLLFKEISSNKDRWVKANIKDTKMRDCLSKIETGYSRLDFNLISNGINYFVENRSKYKDIYNIINKYNDMLAESQITVKIKTVRDRINKHQLYKLQ